MLRRIAPSRPARLLKGSLEACASIGFIAMAYLDGTELDYAREGLNEGFKFNNPNVKDMCGCGESFNV